MIRTPDPAPQRDEVYVGYVAGGTVLEITAMDPHRGPIFYTLDQTAAARPVFERRTDECLTCHGGAMTRDWPGNLVRSVHTSASGDVLTQTGSFVTTQDSPFEQRWGGWYVTGTHGTMRHLGNGPVPSTTAPGELDLEAGANIEDVSDRFPVTSYLAPDSDIVALLVLEHQTEMHNRIARAGYRVAVAMHRQRARNEVLGREPEGLDADTTRVVHEAADEVLEYLLFRNEVALPASVRGTSGFAQEFATLGPADAMGRSLRELDLSTRLFRYPCSYVIYSPSFDAMPAAVLDIVHERLWRVLTGKIGRRSWRLAREQRQAILDILLATKGNLPPFFEPTVVR